MRAQCQSELAVDFPTKKTLFIYKQHPDPILLALTPENQRFKPTDRTCPFISCLQTQDMLTLVNIYNNSS